MESLSLGLSDQTFQCMVDPTHLDCPQYTSNQKTLILCLPNSIPQNHVSQLYVLFRWGAVASGKLDGSRLQVIMSSVEILKNSKWKEIASLKI